MSDTFNRYFERGGENECWEWTGAREPFGHGRYRQQRAHRIAYERAVGPIPLGLCVRHTCDNPPCVNPAHLVVGTQADNMADKTKRGRVHRWNGRRRGEANPCAKLTAENAAEIRRLQGTVTPTKLAERFGVSPSSVYGIFSGQTWTSDDGRG